MPPLARRSQRFSLSLQRLNCALHDPQDVRQSIKQVVRTLSRSTSLPCGEASTCPVLRGEPLAGFLHRKEVIQPQVPLRLPCYDFIPVTSLALGRCLLAVGARTSGETSFHDVTGGVYKTRERIHGAVADAPLLAIPTSWSRVADSNLNWAQFYRFPPPRGFGSFCTGHCSTCAALAVRAIRT
jgi:hypothetical protein